MKKKRFRLVILAEAYELNSALERGVLQQTVKGTHLFLAHAVVIASD